MRHGIHTCVEPTEPGKLYIRCMFHEFFYGPFENENAVVEALKKLDASDPYWDYDCFAIHYGANPLPSDFVLGFNFISSAMRERIERRRKEKQKLT